MIVLFSMRIISVTERISRNIKIVHSKYTKIRHGLGARGIGYDGPRGLSAAANYFSSNQSCRTDASRLEYSAICCPVHRVRNVTRYSGYACAS
jgi:hypothetical protein